MTTASTTKRDILAELQHIRLISETVSHYAATSPTREAVVFEKQRITFADLDKLADRCARALLSNGITKGDRVAMFGTPRSEFLISFLGATRIGAIWMGLNPKYRVEELQYVVGDAQPLLILGQARPGGDDRTSDLEALRDENGSVKRLVLLGQGDSSVWEDLEAFLQEGDKVSDEALKDASSKVTTDDPALIVYTSGSTGRPKGAMLPHRGLVLCSKVQNERWYSEEARVLCNFPINHIACVGDICSYALMGGGTIFFMETFDPEGSLELIEREKINVIGGVPTMLLMMASASGFTSRDLSHLDYIVWSGAAAPPELLRKLEASGAQLATSYGMTETVGSVTYSDFDADLDTLAETIGKPDPHYEIRLIAENGVVSPQGEPGEIQVRGDCNMLGYFNKPEATREAIDEEGWLHTGDLAFERPDGNLKIVGRLSQMYKSGGYNIYPREIEIAIESHPAVALAAVVGVPDPLYQEVGHAFVIPDRGQEVAEEDLRRFCKERLANYKVPKRFVIRESLPMLPVGKIDKVALKKIALDEMNVPSK